MQHQYCYDYCDTYESYDSGLTLDGKNSVKTFSCDECKQSKLILKKSTSDPKFKCEECIQKKEDSTPPLIPTFNPDVVLNLPLSSSFQASSLQASSLQASPAMLTMDGMYQQYQPYQLQQPQEQQQGQQQQGQQGQQQQGQQGQQSQQATFDTTPQFSWRWFNFFV